MQYLYKKIQEGKHAQKDCFFLQSKEVQWEKCCLSASTPANLVLLRQTCGSNVILGFLSAFPLH